MAKSEPLSLVDDARNQTGTTYRYKIVDMADSMPEPLRSEFVAAINDPTVSSRGLSTALRSRGYELAAGTINNWRASGKVLA
jgi:hypothetical protein